MSKERFACQKCPAFYECEKGNINATAGGWEPVKAEVLEVCAGHLRTTAGALDFQDHGYTWWLTEKAVMANTEGAGERI